MVQEGQSDEIMATGPASTASTPPEISILVPVYNAEQYLDDCIASIANQSLDNPEIIFVDDCSTDGSVALIEAAMRTNPKISLFRQTVNQGAPTARNLAISMAGGEYLMFMDADDTLPAKALSSLLHIAKKFDSDAVKGIMLVDSGASKRPTAHALNQKSAHHNTRLADCPEIQHLYQYQSYIFRTSVIRQARIEFDTDLKNFQDPAFLARLLPRCQRIDVCLDPVYVRRVTPDSIITSNWNINNYLSMVNGVTRAYANLRREGQSAAAGVMATTFGSWWHKIRLMPELLTKDECFTVFRGIRSFSQTSNHPLCRFEWLRAGSCHCLQLIAEGKFEQCYQKMAARIRWENQITLPALKLYDVFSYFYAKAFSKL